MIWGFRASGMWSDERGANMLDSGAPYYDTYTCADGRYIAVGAIEPQFYAELLEGLGLDGRRTCPTRTTSAAGPNCAPGSPRCSRRRTATTGPRCSPTPTPASTPVLSFAEVETEPHITERDTFYREDDYLLPRPAPRFSRSAPSKPKPPGEPGADTEAVLRDWV